jgi:hypothetical protein
LVAISPPKPEPMTTTPQGIRGPSAVLSILVVMVAVTVVVLRPLRLSATAVSVVFNVSHACFGRWSTLCDRAARGLAGISAPVMASRAVVAGLTVSGPHHRWTMERMKAFAPTLIAAARDVTATLSRR